MDRLISLFSVYDFLGYVLAGGLVLAGSYWAFAELPPEPGAGAVFGIIALSYMAGHLVQSAATIWEGVVWGKRGIPSTVRMTAPSNTKAVSRKKPAETRSYDEALRALVSKRIETVTGSSSLSVADQFAVARAELRTRQQDGRAELMNTMYGLCRGLATASALLVFVFIAAGVHTKDWTRLGIGAGVMVLSTLLYLRRTNRYSYRFADQVWHDFAALRPVEPGPSETKPPQS